METPIELIAQTVDKAECNPASSHIQIEANSLKQFSQLIQLKSLPDTHTVHYTVYSTSHQASEKYVNLPEQLNSTPVAFVFVLCSNCSQCTASIVEI